MHAYERYHNQTTLTSMFPEESTNKFSQKIKNIKTQNGKGF